MRWRKVKALTMRRIRRMRHNDADATQWLTQILQLNSCRQAKTAYRAVLVVSVKLKSGPKFAYSLEFCWGRLIED